MLNTAIQFVNTLPKAAVVSYAIILTTAMIIITERKYAYDAGDDEITPQNEEEEVYLQYLNGEITEEEMEDILGWTVERSCVERDYTV